MKTVLSYIGWIVDYVESFIVSAIVLLIGGQIISRAMFNLPLKYPEEISMFLMIALVFIGVIVVEKNDSHPKVEFMLDRIPPKWRKGIYMGGKLLTLTLVAAILLSEKQLWPNISPLRSTAAGVPYLWVHSVVVVASFVWALLLVYQIVTFEKSEG